MAELSRNIFSRLNKFVSAFFGFLLALHPKCRDLIV